MKRCTYLILVLFFFIGTSVNAQIADPVKWNFSVEKLSNNSYNLVLKAKIEDKWHLYSQFIPEGGPVATAFKFNPAKEYALKGKTVEKSKVEEKYDASFDMKLKLFSHEAIFIQNIKALTDKPFEIKGELEFMCCDDSRCLPPKTVEFSFSVPASKIVASETVKTESVIPTDDSKLAETSDSIQKSSVDSTNIALKEDTSAVEKVADTSSEKSNSIADESLWGIILLAIAAGLGGVFTPCVYPMIPMTVSFFMQGEDKRSKGIFNGIVFGLSIILVYTLIGAVVAITQSGESVTNYISTNWLPNSIFFLMFVLFALWFFGMFEITLPGSLANKFDQKADKGGIAGAFFMALTLIVVSFSCTGPFVGSILVAATKGPFIKPVVGMFFYGLAFAAPFVIFAISPVLLKKMAKSGSWLNTVKVVVAFILLAFSLKYLSIIDITFHLNMLSREIFLSLWIVIFSMLGFYLLGKLKFPHDSDLPHIPVPRFILATLVFSFVVYMIPGLFGANLKLIGAYLPPATRNSFSIGAENKPAIGGDRQTVLCSTPRYSDFLELPYNLEGYFDLKEGLECAKQKNKPVFLDIKGHFCANCKQMESSVWSDPRVQAKLANDFIIIALYTDDKTPLPESEWITSTYDGKVKKSMDAKNLDYEISMFNTNTQPLYAFLGSDGKPIGGTMGLNLNVEEFLKFLDGGIEAYTNK